MKKSKKRRIRKITGILSKHKKGFGFVTPVDEQAGIGDDIFIPSREMLGAMDRDKVEVRIINGNRGKLAQEGSVEKILTRANKEITGTFVESWDYGYVEPILGKQSEEFLVNKKNYNKAETGDKVVAEIIKWPTKGGFAEVKIKEILCKEQESDGDIKALIRAYGVRDQFPEKVKSFVQSVPKAVEDKDKTGRKDLRDKPIITIDGADAKDLDDGVSVDILENGNFLLGVHIADVSHYVSEGSPLDREAYKRGNSVYLIDLAVPMLPAELSNGICSLNPNSDRLALSINMEINRGGSIVAHEIFTSTIRSKERMTYEDVSDILEHEDERLINRYRHIHQQLLHMEELASTLRERRKNKGSLDFDIDEPHIVLNEDGVPIDIKAAERRVANRIIEEFMLAANETVAAFFYHLKLPFIYRVHEKPSLEKIEEFRRFLSSMGISIKGNRNNIHPGVLNEILNDVRGTDEENIVNSLMLRTMKKAYYNIDCIGHFGLGMECYCHFTAPIRRYPDLIVHRIIKEFLTSGIYGDRLDVLKRITEKSAVNSSETERKTEELEREVQKLKKAEYMECRIGKEYKGIISGIASFGFFVELENTVEGLVRIDSIHDDYYTYEPEAYRFFGSRNKRIYSLGRTVWVKVDSVDVSQREIRFVISDRDSKMPG